ncbi:response regulator transcription factor [Paenibacillus piri]|uniref:Heme response regulator HssR n=1 Tax=Paenibacillus piri TaxID=2547395 RepID=A0A4V2ZS90_9BACL|nr:response regulator transcription factor [Paenibacillus piri]TDF92334.1 response regulator transcription factor [Paenibacillus piri]
MANLLVVDDDNHIRELMTTVLRQEGYGVMEAENGRQALVAMNAVKADLVVFDIMMPEMDGWKLCARLRSDYPDLPLLMVTAKGETGQKVKGFELGTDDYLVKPFDPIELVVRVKALLKRYRIDLSSTIQCGTVALDRQQFEVIRGAERLTLPLKEFELLYMLASRPGQIFTRNQFIEHIWGTDYEGDERTVDVHIKRLRERFPEETSGFAITTIRGLGYKLEVRM